jgi:hypothetical protein
VPHRKDESDLYIKAVITFAEHAPRKTPSDGDPMSETDSLSTGKRSHPKVKGLVAIGPAKDPRGRCRINLHKKM